MKTVLIVDDDAASLELAERMLEAEGYETRSATGPGDALEILKTWKPEAILLDVQLQGLDSGLEFARRLKANVATSATPVVVYTAYGDRRTEAEARAAGCDGYLEKPVTARKLAETIRESVRGPDPK
jgi:two-component system cell cycle response regulator DivK